jgi:hypothetical protein
MKIRLLFLIIVENFNQILSTILINPVESLFNKKEADHDL